MHFYIDLQEEVYMLQPPPCYKIQGETKGLQTQKDNLWFETVSTSMVWQIQFCCCTPCWSLYICTTFFYWHYYFYSFCWYCYHWRWLSMYHSLESLFEFLFSYERPWSLEAFSRDWVCLLSERSVSVLKKISYWFIKRNWYIRI